MNDNAQAAQCVKWALAHESTSGRGSSESQPLVRSPDRVGLRQLWSHCRIRCGRKSSKRRMRPTSLTLKRTPSALHRASDSAAWLQTSRKGTRWSAGRSHANCMSRHRVLIGTRVGRPDRARSSRVSTDGCFRNRAHHLQTVRAADPRRRATSARPSPAAENTIICARRTTSYGSLPALASASRSGTRYYFP